VTDDSDEELAPTYTLEQQQRLTTNLAALTQRVHEGFYRAQPLNLALLCELHAGLFDGVADHAGRHRKPGFGGETKVFGPNQSTHRNDVERKLGQVFERVARDMRPLQGAQGAEAYEEEAIRLAVWAHAEIVHVHPFEDGNGRTSRLCAGHILVQLGLRPVPIEAVKQEYTAALNLYFRSRDLAPLLDLYIRLYPVDRGELTG
jgi:fido (protein-threonine AMPylation protein)